MTSHLPPVRGLTGVENQYRPHLQVRGHRCRLNEALRPGTYRTRPPQSSNRLLTPTNRVPRPRQAEPAVPRSTVFPQVTKWTAHAHEGEPYDQWIMGNEVKDTPRARG